MSLNYTIGVANRLFLGSTRHQNRVVFGGPRGWVVSYERGTPVGKWQGFSLSGARFKGEWQGASLSGSRFLANPCRQISQANSCTQHGPANPYQRFLRADRSSKSLRADRYNEFLTPRTKEFPRTTARRSVQRIPASSALENFCQQLSPENSCPLSTSKPLPAAQPCKIFTRGPAQRSTHHRIPASQQLR